MSTPGMMPPQPPVPGAPGAPAQPKSKTWLYVLLGCGGCAVVALGVVMVGGFFAVKKGAQGINTFGSTVMLAAEQAQLDTMVKDPARKERIDKAFGELSKKAGNGQLSVEEVKPLTEKVEQLTKGKTTLTDDEADEVAEAAEKLE